MAAIPTPLSRGWQLHQQRRLAEAEQVYRQALQLNPGDANAWCYLGMVLNDQRRYDQAVEAYRQALSIRPLFPEVLNNLGNSLRYVGDYELADQSFQQAIELRPDYANAYKNRGTLHAWNGRLELALQYYQQALQLAPADAELHRNLGVIYLLQGRFEEGWEEYRWRWQTGDLRRVDSLAVWDGSPPAGKTFLLTVEQGLGDTLQFVRFAPWLRQRGAKTLIYCQPALLPLLQSSPALGPCYPNNLPLLQPFDFQCSLLDVADIARVDPSSLPAVSGYIQAAPHLRQYWRVRLPPPAGQLRVGIAWQGNPEHQADLYRSIPLRCFEPLSRIAGVELVSLQRGFGLEQLDGWQGKPLTKLDPSVDTSSGAFMDTAAILPLLDLVVTSDTSIAHLAGAMGVPTWIALSHLPDWRWLLERNDSPWYPSVRLFRQPGQGDWASVFREITEALVQRVRPLGGPA